jgi:hypothetical protein
MLDWKKTEDRLFKWSQTTIRKFGREYPNENICAMFFDSEPRYGYVVLAFDTFENSIRSAKEMENFAIKSRNRNLNDADAWCNARYQINTPVLSVFNTNSGDFVYPDYAEIEFKAWQRLVESKNYSKKYPKRFDQDDDYLDGNVRILLWKVVERLIATKSFQPLKLASPFIVGYAFHDEEEVILRVLNWPV